MPSLLSIALLPPVDPSILDSADRVNYLRILWNADIPPAKFVAMAHRLGYLVMCHWDSEYSMPVLEPLH